MTFERVSDALAAACPEPPRHLAADQIEPAVDFMGKVGVAASQQISLQMHVAETVAGNVRDFAMSTIQRRRARVGAVCRRLFAAARVEERYQVRRHVLKDGTVQPVPDRLPLPPRRNQVGVAQNTEMPRHRGKRDWELFGDLAGRPLPVTQ
jgi:hypothetical protein